MHFLQNSRKPRKTPTSSHLLTRYEAISSGGDDSGGGGGSRENPPGATRSHHRNRHYHSHCQQHRHGVIPSSLKRRQPSSASPSPSVSVYKARRRRKGTFSSSSPSSSSSTTSSFRAVATNTLLDNISVGCIIFLLAIIIVVIDGRISCFMLSTASAPSEKVTTNTRNCCTIDTKVFTRHSPVLYILFLISVVVGIISLTDGCQCINALSTRLMEPETTTPVASSATAYREARRHFVRLHISKATATGHDEIILAFDISRAFAKVAVVSHPFELEKPRKTPTSSHLLTRYEAISSGGDDSGGGGGSRENPPGATRSHHRNRHYHSHCQQHRHGVIPSSLKRRQPSSASPSPSVSVYKARRRRKGTFSSSSPSSSSSTTSSFRAVATNTLLDNISVGCIIFLLAIIIVVIDGRISCFMLSTASAPSEKVTTNTRNCCTIDTKVFTRHSPVLYILFLISVVVGIISLTDGCQCINALSTRLMEPETTTVG
ncbi:hypothetical protein EGR_08029 [Echinococcus granulosus]|uniref:Uncharacterized protein n=1 Tax=Echinococcus granulosus TaxID=6210 RepID=W6U7J8_ECHGR|nr:hypothetical protein EGR_08029 [Echinococcus granulosus]EUB57145.1 hypothetical protein EGR_08029 [Echinococcus granulosus]